MREDSAAPADLGAHKLLDAGLPVEDTPHLRSVRDVGTSMPPLPGLDRRASRIGTSRITLSAMGSSSTSATTLSQATTILRDLEVLVARRRAARHREDALLAKLVRALSPMGYSVVADHSQKTALTPRTKFLRGAEKPKNSW